MRCLCDCVVQMELRMLLKLLTNLGAGCTYASLEIVQRHLRPKLLYCRITFGQKQLQKLAVRTENISLWLSGQPGKFWWGMFKGSGS